MKGSLSASMLGSTFSLNVCLCRLVKDSERACRSVELGIGSLEATVAVGRTSGSEAVSDILFDVAVVEY